MTVLYYTDISVGRLSKDTWTNEGSKWKLTRKVAPKPLQFMMLLPTA